MTLEDFRGADGRIDWEAHDKAEVACGRRCMTCRAAIPSFGRPERERECASCRELRDDSDEVTHEDRLRCPACRHTWNAACGDDPVWEEGEHCVRCLECDHEFDVSTRVSFTFTSPAILDEEGGEG